MRTILNNRYLLWTILAVPACAMILAYGRGTRDAMDLIHPSGEWSARLMIIAMMIGPALAVFGARPILLWMVRRRRYFGVAASLYALLHLILYTIDMGNVDDMLAEIGAPGIWTGWIAFLLFIPIALTSHDAAMRWLKAGWKRVQRLVYPAALFTLLHWIWVHNSFGGAMVHFAPLAVLYMLWGVTMLRRRAARPVSKPLSNH